MTDQVARLGDTISHGGYIIEASPDVYSDGIQVARLLDAVQCAEHGVQYISGASSTVLANGKRVARVYDPISCGAFIVPNDSNTLVGD